MVLPPELCPINSDEQLETVLNYIAEQSRLLSSTVVGEALALDTICLFTHGDAEYEFVKAALLKRGPRSDLSHGPTTYIAVRETISGQHVSLLGVRGPDDTRPELGYADYPVEDYSYVLAKLQRNEFAHEIVSGLGHRLIELRHSDFYIRGYIAGEDHIS